MDVYEHERLSKFTLKGILKYRNIAFIAVLHFTSIFNILISLIDW